MPLLKIYGSSDDIICVHGEGPTKGLSNEYSFDTRYFRLSCGTTGKVWYDEEGIWRIKLGDTGHAKVKHLRGIPDDASEVKPGDVVHGDPDGPVYSDVLIVEADKIEWVKMAGKPLPVPENKEFKITAIIVEASDKGLLETGWSDMNDEDKAKLIDFLTKRMNPVDAKTSPTKEGSAKAEAGPVDRVMKIYLENTSDGSSKFYELTVVPEGSGYALDYRNGRIGTEGRTGRKTDAPLTLDEASALASNLAQEKVSGKYVVVSSTPVNSPRN
jgi:predicted DNA-binding WGR domain protein